jgi:DNA replication protein DnaC
MISKPTLEDDEKEQKSRLARLDYFDEMLKEEKKQRIIQDVPERFKAAKLSDFSKIDRILEWIQKPKDFLMIIGPCGTGKTHLACAMTMDLRTKGMFTKLVFSSTLFLQLRNSFNNGGQSGSEMEIIESMIKPDILIVDDLGVQKQSDYVTESWYTIIDTRYRNNRPMACTSNLNLKEIASVMSERIASRLMSGTVVSLIGGDKRRGK